MLIRMMKIENAFRKIHKVSDAEFGERQKKFSTPCCDETGLLIIMILYFILMEAKFFFLGVRSSLSLWECKRKNLAQTVFLSFNLWNNVKKA